MNNDYIFETEDNSNIIKAKSSKVVYLNVKYAKEIPEEEYESGSFNDDKTMTLSLSTRNYPNN